MSAETHATNVWGLGGGLRWRARRVTSSASSSAYIRGFCVLSPPTGRCSASVDLGLVAGREAPKNVEPPLQPKQGKVREHVLLLNPSCMHACALQLEALETRDPVSAARLLRETGLARETSVVSSLFGVLATWKRQARAVGLTRRNRRKRRLWTVAGGRREQQLVGRRLFEEFS